MAALVPAPVAVRPAPASVGWLRVIDALANRIEPHGMTLRPTETQLTQITARVLVLRQSLTPGPFSRVRLLVALLLSHWYPGRGLPRERADAIVLNYANVLEPLPAWAVQDGNARLLRGQVAGLSPDFPPSAPRVYATAREELTPYRAELDRLIAIQAAVQHENLRF